MSGLRCKPDQLCIVIRSNCGNEGREVTTVRYVKAFDRLPELGPKKLAAQECWLVKARHPLIRPRGGVSEYGLFDDVWLLPLDPPAEPVSTPTDTPVRETA